MELTLTELKKLFELVHNKLESEGVNQIEMPDEDYYWIINAPEWTMLDKQPKAAVGSFIDDLESLKKIISGEHVTTYVDFDRLASILRLISYLRNPPGENNISR